MIPSLSLTRVLGNLFTIESFGNRKIRDRKRSTFYCIKPGEAVYFHCNECGMNNQVTPFVSHIHQQMEQVAMHS